MEDIVCDIPKEGVENTMNTESTIEEERKNDKELSSCTDEMKTESASVINDEISLETLRISLAGKQAGSLKKKLLVLDVNGVLADVVSPPPKEQKADATIARRAIFKRPFYLEFLKFCFDNFEVGIWSSRLKKNVDRVIGYLMGDMKNKLLFCWDLSHCTETSFKTLENKHKFVVFKDLRKLWEKHDPNLPWEKGYYNESNTLLMDDSPYKGLLNPPNTSVFPHTFTYQNKSDNSLAVGGDLREYLDGLANAEDMPKYVKEHPFGQEAISETSQSWNFYLPVIGSLNTESTKEDERKNEKELSSCTDEMKTESASVINEEISLETLRISLAGKQVGSLKKKLLVLDINGVLADVVSPPPKDQKADATIARRAIFKRPFYLEFLKFCFDKFEVGIWSSRMKKNVDRAIDYLMGDMRNKLLFCWDLSHCTETSFKTLENKHKFVVFKDLRKLWEKHDPNLPWEKGYYNESNTLLMDDSPYKGLLNPPNTSVFPHTFTYQNKSDNSLAEGGDLREYLDGLANAEDIPKYVEEHPFGQEAISETSQSWNFYLRVIGSLNASQPEDIVSVNVHSA